MRGKSDVSLVPNKVFCVVRGSVEVVKVLLLVYFTVLTLPCLVQRQLYRILPLCTAATAKQGLFSERFRTLITYYNFIKVMRFNVCMLICIVGKLTMF